MEQNSNPEATDVSRLYIEALQDREAAERAVVLSEKVEYLLNSNRKLEVVLERTVMYGTGLSAVLNGMVRLIHAPGVLAAAGPDNEVPLKEIEHSQHILTGIRGAFRPEAAFYDRFSQMARARILQEHGIDPTDAVAVNSFMNAAVDSVVLPGSPKN